VIVIRGAADARPLAPPVLGPVAVLGLGVTRRPVALHLAVAGVAVRAWNRMASRIPEVGTAPGLVICWTPADAVRLAPAVIVMLSSGAIVDEVLFDGYSPGAGVAEDLEPGSMVVVTSSIP
jgi:3-hydroxyisobutyrate dehydrogenase-like beta-hydroxyacid dehydrogenase